MSDGFRVHVSSSGTYPSRVRTTHTLFLGCFRSYSRLPFFSLYGPQRPRKQAPVAYSDTCCLTITAWKCLYSSGTGWTRTRAIPDDSIFVTKIATRLTSDIAVFPPLVSSIYSGLLARLDRSSFQHTALFSLNIILLSLNTGLIFVPPDIASFRALIYPRDCIRYAYRLPYQRQYSASSALFFKPV